MRTRLDCTLVCLYFACLPLTAVPTPFGSLLRVATLPIAALLGLRLIRGKTEFTLNSVHLFHTLYVLYTALSLAVRPSRAGAVTALDMGFGLLMLLLVSLHHFDGRDQERMESAWLMAGLVCVLSALASRETLNAGEHRTVIQILGSVIDPNYFCAALLLPVLVSTRRFLERRRFYPLYLLAVFLSVCAVLRTGSRGGLAGLLCGLLAYFLLGVRGVRRRAAFLAGAAVVAAAVLWLVLPALPPDVRLRYTAASVLESGATGRFDLWRYLLGYTLRSPQRTLWGSGLLSSYEILYAAGFSNGAAHNTLLQVFCDQGLVGLALYLLLAASCLLRTVRCQPLYASAFVGIMALSMTLTFYEFKPYLNILMMCAMTFGPAQERRTEA